MKVSLNQLLSLQGKPLTLDLEVADEFVDLQHSVLKKVETCHVRGNIVYDSYKQHASTNLNIVGSMILPHSVTNQAVSIPFDTQLVDVFSFAASDVDEDVIEVVEDFIDFGPYILEAILATIPLRIVDENPYEYPSGKGWKVMSEEEYEALEKPMDPRLAKLKEFKFD